MNDPLGLTVGQLRELIKDLPDEADVWSDGCDCVGQAGGVEIDSDGVLILRIEHVPTEATARE